MACSMRERVKESRGGRGTTPGACAVLRLTIHRVVLVPELFAVQHRGSRPPLHAWALCRTGALGGGINNSSGAGPSDVLVSGRA